MRNPEVDRNRRRTAGPPGRAYCAVHDQDPMPLERESMPADPQPTPTRFRCRSRARAGLVCQPLSRPLHEVGMSGSARLFRCSTIDRPIHRGALPHGLLPPLQPPAQTFPQANDACRAHAYLDLERPVISPFAADIVRWVDQAAVSPDLESRPARTAEPFDIRCRQRPRREPPDFRSVEGRGWRGRQRLSISRRFSVPTHPAFSLETYQVIRGWSPNGRSSGPAVNLRTGLDRAGVRRRRSLVWLAARPQTKCLPPVHLPV